MTEHAGADSGVVLVPHFHWDREWYEPFQVFRHRLIRAMDTILDIADEEPAFRFTLDGQTAVALDYLEIRPEHEQRLRAAVERGQIALGPWLILLDEFLCSGETIVRNLELGWRAAEELGGAMPFGYLPDMFGHVAQMPQILSRAGIRHSGFWRGVPSNVHGHSFVWEAPDGSQVRAEYLFDGYGNGLDLLLVPDDIPKAINDYRALTRSRWGNDPILGMAGTDHLPPSSDLMTWVRRFATNDHPIHVATIEEYVRRHVVDPAPVLVHGELRSHARSNLLPGVLSIRHDLKKAMSTAEGAAVQAERAAAMWSDEDHSAYLHLAWRKIVESSAHDSVVGSGTDETVEQVKARLAEAEQAGRAVRDSILSSQAATVPADGWLVWNPLTTSRTGLVEISATRRGQDPMAAIDSEGSPLPVQLLSSSTSILSDEFWPAADVARVLRRIHRRELFGLLIDHVDLGPGRLTFHLSETPSATEFDLLGLTIRVRELAEEFTEDWHVLTMAEPVDTLLVAVPLPPSGLAAVAGAAAVPASPATPAHAVEATAHAIANGAVSVAIADDGTLSISGGDGTTLHGVGRIVDGGDRGDLYNYGPPEGDRLVSQPSSVSTVVVERGPLRGVVRVTREYEWLSNGRGDAADVDTAVHTRIDTDVEVRIDEPFVRLTVSFVNQSADHRVRLHIPVGDAVNHSEAEGQFFVTRRGLTAEGGWGEYPLPTFPADGFVAAGDAVVLLETASEYELVEDGRELAVTMLRAVGSMSVNLHPLRDEPAASQIPTPGAQELGSRVVARYGILPAGHGWENAGAVAASEVFRSDPIARPGSGPLTLPLPAARQGLAVSGPSIAVTSLRRTANGTQLRLVGLSGVPQDVSVAGAFDQLAETDLLGRAASARDALGVVRVEPWQILTLELS